MARKPGRRLPRAEKLAPLVRQPSRPPVEIDTKLATVAGLAIIAALLAASALHVSWASGGTWGIEEGLGAAGARSVERGEAGALAGIWIIVALLLLSGVIVAGRLGWLGDRFGAFYRWGARTLFVVFLVRAILGFITSGTAVGDAAGDHATWDLFLISPLTLILAVLTGLVALSSLGPGEGRPPEDVRQIGRAHV
jgi:hypothetical protein